MFKFNFSELDLEDDVETTTERSEPESRFTTSTTTKPASSHNVSTSSEDVKQFHELSIAELVRALPSAFSYSPLVVPLSEDVGLGLNGSSGEELDDNAKRTRDGRNGNMTTTLLRRDLFDARFQLIAEDTNDGSTASIPASQSKPTSEPTTSFARLESENRGSTDAIAFIDNPSDLVPGVYEGGLKTWECSLDLVDCLATLFSIDGSNDGGVKRIRGKRVVEIGCGTAIPSLYLLHELFSHPLLGNSNSSPETEIVLQDYNDLVLRLVTFPNVLLAWYASPLAESYRSQHTATEAEVDEEPWVFDPSQPGDMYITSALLPAFLSSLKEQRISLRFIAGSWEALSCNTNLFTTTFDLTLTSETIYQTSSLPALIGLLRCASLGASRGSSKCAEDSERDIKMMTRDLSLEDHGRLCLVAAKVLYFGVGGGVMDFERAVIEWGGKLTTILQKSAGVGRKVMKVDW